MTERQSKTWRALGTVLGAALLAVGGAVGGMNIRPAEAGPAAGVSRAELEKAVEEVNVARVADTKALAASIDLLSQKVDAKFEKLSDSQQQTRETIAGLAAEVRYNRQERYRNGERGAAQ